MLLKDTDAWTIFYNVKTISTEISSMMFLLDQSLFCT